MNEISRHPISRTNGSDNSYELTMLSLILENTHFQYVHLTRLYELKTQWTNRHQRHFHSSPDWKSSNICRA